jgi:uncharacterized repeat protein (TIGR01451 family)
VVGARHAVGRLPLRVWLACATVCLSLAGFASVLVSSAQADAPVGTFQARASSSQPLTSVAVDPTTGLIYAQGNGDTTFFRYNPSTDTWTSLPAAPLSSGNNGGAVYLNGKIYTVYTGNSASMGVYDIASNSWTTIPNPLGAGTGDITTANGLLYLVEGNAFVSFNPATNTTTTLAAAPNFTGDCSGEGFTRWGGLQVYQGRIYGHQGDGCNGFAVYDIASNTWTELTPLPDDAVLGSAIDQVSGTYFAYGSYSGSSFYEYNIAAGTWSTITFPFSDINDGGMAYVSQPGQQGIYAIEGQNSTGFTRFVTALPSANLSLTKTASTSKATVGDAITYTIHVTNGGPNDALSTTVTDTLPADVTFVSSSTTRGSCSGSTTVTCHLGTLANGQSATVTINVKANKAGTATNTATVSTTSTDTNTANNKASATTTISLPKLKLKLSSHTARAGQRACFSFTATSGGKGVRGVTVRLGSHKAKTSSKGKAKICGTFKRGTYHARASKSGFRSVSATVRILAARRATTPRRAPSFTG